MATKRKRPPTPKGDGSSVVAPSPRALGNDWSPSRIALAERQANAGDLSLAAACCEWLLSNERIAGGLDARNNALFGLEPSFEASGDKRRSNRAVKALEAGEDWWRAYPESQLALMHKWGLLLGVGLATHAWTEKPGHDGRILPMLKFLDPHTLRFTEQRWTFRDASNATLEVVPGDSTWVLHMPYGDQRPWAYGLWRSLALWSLLKRYAITDSGTAGENGSLLVGTSPDGSTKEQRQDLANSLLANGKDRVAILAAGYDLKSLQMSAATGEFYKGQVEMADAAVSIRIRGGNLSSQVKEGSHAAAKSQAETNEEPMLRFDAQTVTTTTHDQSLVWWAEFNFGDAGLAPWPVYPVEPEEDKQARATMVGAAADGAKKLEDLGFELDDRAFQEEFGLTFVKGRKSPEQRAQEAAEAFERQKTLTGGESGDDDPTDPKAPKPPKPAPGKDKGKAKAAAGGFVAALASGASVADNPGLVGGQLYADSVVESATAAGNAALEPFLVAMAREIEASTSFEDMRERLRALHAEHEVEESLDELMYRAMLLGELAGRRGVTQDS